MKWRKVEGNIKMVMEDNRIRKREMKDIVKDVIERKRIRDFRKDMKKKI